MAGVLRCRICGKEYEGCRSSNLDPTVFRWKDVACCEEHGEEYLRKVLESRGQAPAKKQEAKKIEKKVQDDIVVPEIGTYKSRSRKYNSERKADNDSEK